MRTAPTRGWRRRRRSMPRRLPPRPSKHALGARQVAALAPECLPQCACHGLEAGLDLVVVVVAIHLEVQVEARAFAQRTEEMRHQFGRHVADALALEAAVEPETGPSREIQRGTRQGLVHREGEAITADA